MLRAGIVGCGKIADSHVEQIRATGRAEVRAVCDSEALMAEQLATRMQIPRCYSDLATMLADEQLDVVHIATPPSSHLAIARQAMQAGCHVFMEKPFALDASQTLEILELAEKLSRQVGVNYLYNFESPALELERLLADARLGQIVHLDCSYGYNLGGDYGLAVLSDPAHWVHSLPGKLFHNVLDHVLAKLVFAISENAEVQVVALRRRPASGNAPIDAMRDELRVMLRAGDVTATCVISAHARPVSHSLRVVGTLDTIDIDYAARTLVFAPRQTQPSAVGRLMPAWIQARQYRRNLRRNLGEFRRHEFHYFQGMRVLLNRYYDSVVGSAPPPISAAQILRVSRLIDKIVVAIDATGSA
ncbi:MAG: Gfo/Idh/MocA family oxidoreductase [Pseudomonadota bacterium]